MKNLNRFPLVLMALSLMLLAACSTPGGSNPEQVRQVLAPSGKLRVGVYAGSPSSIVVTDTVADAKGVGFDLGKVLAAQLGVPFEPVVFPANSGVLAAVEAGRVDVTFTNATPERAQHMDFSSTYMDVEKSFLVPAASPLATLSDMRRAGLRVGVSAGSSTAEELRPLYPGAVLIAVPTLAQAGKMLAAGELDAFATNKAILFEMSDGLKGSRVLPGHWGMEHFGAAIPKGRTQALPYLSHFIDAARAGGEVQHAIERANLRGTVAPGAADN